MRSFAMSGKENGTEWGEMIRDPIEHSDMLQVNCVRRCEAVLETQKTIVAKVSTKLVIGSVVIAIGVASFWSYR